jgi:hypothetical protein
MPEAFDIAQAAIAVANTEQSLYVVPAATEVIISTLKICNRGSAKATYRWAIVPGGGSAGAANWQEYDAEVDGNVTEFRTLGDTLPALAELRIQADTTDISFTISFVKVT